MKQRLQLTKNEFLNCIDRASLLIRESDKNQLLSILLTFIKIKYHKKGLIPEEGTYLFGDYILPLRITSVSKYGISPDAASKLYTVKFQPDPIDKKGWSVIDFNNCCTKTADGI